MDPSLQETMGFSDAVQLLKSCASKIKFMHSIVNTIRSCDMKAVFTILEGETASNLVKDLGMFVDKIIHYK